MAFTPSSCGRYEKLHDTEIDELRSDVKSSSSSSLIPLHASQFRQPSYTLRPIPKTLLAISSLLNLALTSVIFYTISQGSTGARCGQLLYSPAQDAISYQAVKFRDGFKDDVSIYQGDPSPEVDQAWVDLYDSWGVVRMNSFDAARLPNKTYPWPGDPGYYIGELSVAHQLHCLNKLRQGVFAEYYRSILNPEDFEPSGTLGKHHLSHCVESIRQALICASDISVMVWTWDDRIQQASINGTIVHSCRNFESIRNWAKQHTPVVKFNGSIYVENDLYSS